MSQTTTMTKANRSGVAAATQNGVPVKVGAYLKQLTTPNAHAAVIYSTMWWKIVLL
jgi:hypothetical protein